MAAPPTSGASTALPPAASGTAGYAPIALFAYARPDHLRRTIEALLANPGAAQSDLIVFSDAARTPDRQGAVNEVRRYLQSVTGFRSLTVQAQATNRGLARSIIDGVTTMLKSHDTIIVLEDDMETAPGFLRYMNDALTRFAHDDRVISVHAYMYPIASELPSAFFLPGADCWGWGTWKRGWQIFNPDGSDLLAQLQARDLLNYFDFNGAYPYSRMLSEQIAGRNDSWAVRWYASALLAGKLTLYPGRSLVHNIGNDSTGTHSADVGFFDVALTDRSVDLSAVEVFPCEDCRGAIEKFLRSARSSWPRGALARIRRLLAILPRKRQQLQ